MLGAPVWIWLILLLVIAVALTALKDFFLIRKIQPGSFRWSTFRVELLFVTINLVGSAILIGGLIDLLNGLGLISYSKASASWWVLCLEYLVFFFLFDTWLFWFHRFWHLPLVYPYVHKLHHYSVSPNPLTALSVHPVESLVNYGFLPIYTAVAVILDMPIHADSMILIGPTAILMGLYAHSGFEFLPRWWNKSWFTKWFITATFHDQHHRYFNYNYGGFTTIWDHICGTVRTNYDADFDKLKMKLADKA